MKICLLISVVLMLSSFAIGQSDFKKNDVYVEAGGNGLFGSINYERQLTKEPGLGVRFGVGFYTENAFYVTIPLGINYLFKLKKKNTFIDAGLGTTWCGTKNQFFSSSNNINGESFFNLIPSVGYRKHTVKNVMWRISATPVINKHGLVPWIGFSIGKRF